jgi:hypothetical protein
MRGLVIKVPHIDRILSGEKVWEIRSSMTKVRGEIALIQSGTGMIVGRAEIVESISLSVEELKENFKKHLALTINYPKPHAWVIANARRIAPVPYTHPKGAIIWIKLNEETSAKVQPL